MKKGIDEMLLTDYTEVQHDKGKEEGRISTPLIYLTLYVNRSPALDTESINYKLLTLLLPPYH
jgi:hypothetical protein